MSTLRRDTQTDPTTFSLRGKTAGEENYDCYLKQYRKLSMACIAKQHQIALRDRFP